MRILIADDHTLFRESLRSLLTAHGFEIAGEAREGREAVELAHRATHWTSSSWTSRCRG